MRDLLSRQKPWSFLSDLWVKIEINKEGWSVNGWYVGVINKFLKPITNKNII